MLPNPFKRPALRRLVLTGASVLLVTGALVGTLRAQEKELLIPWQTGPSVVELADVGQITVPAGCRFVGAKWTRTLLEWMEETINGNEIGFLAPNENDATWFVIFEFSETGHVSDNEKDNLDRDAILTSIRKGTQDNNLNWECSPQYNEQTRHLQWAVCTESNELPVVNYNTCFLGRTGVMEINLVAAPDNLARSLPVFQSLLSGYSYLPGNRYAEFHQDDKIAQFGLSALVTGGAATVPMKTGLLQHFWKFLVAGIVGTGAFFKKLYGSGNG